MKYSKYFVSNSVRAYTPDRMIFPTTPPPPSPITRRLKNSHFHLPAPLDGHATNRETQYPQKGGAAKGRGAFIHRLSKG